MKSIRSRISELEKQSPVRPIKGIYQDWDDPELWHFEGPQEGAALTWDQVLRQYPDHDFIKVTYTDDWKATP